MVCVQEGLDLQPHFTLPSYFYPTVGMPGILWLLWEGKSGTLGGAVSGMSNGPTTIRSPLRYMLSYCGQRAVFKTYFWRSLDHESSSCIVPLFGAQSNRWFSLCINIGFHRLHTPWDQLRASGGPLRPWGLFPWRCKNPIFRNLGYSTPCPRQVSCTSTYSTSNPSPPYRGALVWSGKVGPPIHGRLWWFSGCPRAGCMASPGDHLDLQLVAYPAGPSSVPWPTLPGSPSDSHVGACMYWISTTSFIPP